jgi:hypothetical protein
MTLQPGEELAHHDDPHNNKGLDHANGKGLFRWRVRNLEHPAVLPVDGNDIQIPTVPTPEIVDPSIPEQGRPPVNLPYVTPSGPLKLGDVASVLRSKNAGPFEVTFDVMFETGEMYQAVQDSGLLSQSLVEVLYNLTPQEIVWCGWFHQALAWKCTVSPSSRESLLE